MSTPAPRQPEHAIHPLFIERWSPRSFTGEPIDDAVLLSLFEAARWAPSANNSQPWRFIFARQGSPEWQAILALANDNNRRWAQRSGVLVALVSKQTHVRNGDTAPTPLRNHSLDAGAAWASLALQAAHAGLSTHAIGGFDRDKAVQVLGIPAGFHIEILFAVGHRADKSLLEADLQAREQPTARRPLADFVAEGRFAFTE